jgi:hypothetical protein
MTRSVSRRIGLLEARAGMAAKDRSVSIRVRLVGPAGVTSVLLFETDKPTMEVPPTAEEVEEVRASGSRSAHAFCRRAIACHLNDAHGISPP